MKKNRKPIIVILVFICLLSFLLISTYLYINDINPKDKTIKVSVLVYGNDSERWATMKKGLDQGAADYGVEINFVTMTSESDSEEQEMLLEREIGNGSKGIILAASDSIEMTSIVNEASQLLPIVLVETNINETNKLTFISADNYSMGLNIGRSVILNCNEKKKIAVFIENLQRSSINQRYQGLMDSLRYTENIIIPWEMEEHDFDASLYLHKMLTKDQVDVIVALSDKSLETVADAIGKSSTVNIYGIGSTKKVVHYVDYGIVNSIVFQNEFNMGYLAIQALIHSMNEKESLGDIEVEFRTVNRDTMYLPKNQRLVFPIVQ